MFVKHLSLVILLVGALTCDEEAVLEDEYDDTEEYRLSGSRPSGEGRSARLLWTYHPMIDLMSQTSGKKYGYKEPEKGDFFAVFRDTYTLPDGIDSPLPEYDFIIIGAGSAGSVLASRLTKNKNTTVLLIEAGKPEMLMTDIPAMAPYFQSTDYTWQYYMERQQGVCMGMINERCFWPRGKAVGGSSVVNYMIYTRGRPQEWDRIAADGNYGWSYKEVLQYFKKSEKADLDGYEQNPYRNRDGEMPVQFTPKRTKLGKAFLEAGRILGHPTVDYNAPDVLGFGYVQATTNKGHRHSAAKVFLHPNKKRRNLHIMPETTATKILIDPKSKTAYGVKFVNKGIKYTSRVRKEVILSAGPIASPQMLMLSGIGPREHLISKRIPVIKDLPVGKTLYDHIAFTTLVFTLNTTRISFNEARAMNIKTFIDWLRDGDNDLSSPGGVEAIGYIKTPVSDDPEPVPDIELISVGGSIVTDGGPDGSRAVRRGIRVSESVFNSAFGAVDNSESWSSLAMLLHPKSVGYLELKDKNPFSHPKLYGNYLTDPRDVATMIAAIRHIQKLAATAPFQKFGTKLHRAQYSTCPDIPFDSDAYWECALRTITTTLHHQIATCRMGPVGDSRAVVDPELRVHGINSLRVVDSSVIPRTISAHTHAPAVMIGEKGADLIKSTWNIF